MGLLERIRKTIQALVTAPLRFSSVEWEPWKSMGMRKVPVKNDLVFYLVAEEDQTISVVRIFYGGRK